MSAQSFSWTDLISFLKMHSVLWQIGVQYYNCSCNRHPQRKWCFPHDKQFPSADWDRFELRVECCCPVQYPEYIGRCLCYNDCDYGSPSQEYSSQSHGSESCLPCGTVVIALPEALSLHRQNWIIRIKWGL